MDNTTPFPCSQCGECCRHIDQVPQLVPFDLGNGVCRYLKGNLCSIYETRPEICRVDVMYERYYKTRYTREAFYQLNLKGCEALKQRLRSPSGEPTREQKR